MFTQVKTILHQWKNGTLPPSFAPVGRSLKSDDFEVTTTWRETSRCPQQQTLASLSVSGVCDWLRDLEMESYIASFAAMSVDGATLVECNADDLNDLGVVFAPHRRKLLRLISGCSAATLRTSPSSVGDMPLEPLLQNFGTGISDAQIYRGHEMEIFNYTLSSTAAFGTMTHFCEQL